MKSRGYRIELGEVEAALREHAAVRDAIVVARTDIEQDTRLIATWYAIKRPSPSPRQMCGTS